MVESGVINWVYKCEKEKDVPYFNLVVPDAHPSYFSFDPKLCWCVFDINIFRHITGAYAKDENVNIKLKWTGEFTL